MKLNFRGWVIGNRGLGSTVAFLLVGLLAPTTVGQHTLEKDGSLRLTAGHVISRVTGRARAPLKPDPVGFQLLQNPSRIFSEGETAGVGDNEQEWKQVTAAENGQFQGREYSGSYLQFVVHSEQPQVVLLEANGHGAAVVNGQPRSGDPYSKWQQLPIKIRAGKNQLLFQVGRGRFSGQLLPVEKPVYLTTGDTTLPNWVRGETQLLHAAMPLINASESTLSDLEIQTRVEDGPVCATPVGPVLPLSLRKVRFDIHPPDQAAKGPLTVTVKLVFGYTKSKP